MSQAYSNDLRLYGAITQAELIYLVRNQCIQEEIDNLDNIISEWRNAATQFQNIVSAEQGIQSNIQSNDMDSEFSSVLEQIENDPLFRNTFSTYPIEFKMVEVDKLIAPQRHVSVEYVEQLNQQIPSNPSIRELIDICLSPRQNPPIPNMLQNMPNMVTYTSPSVDFRFLGGYPKPLTQDDIQACLGGGLPVSAIVLLVGYGAGSINILQTGDRWILNNGFHRVYTLRRKGITHIPVVVQRITNPDLEMQPVVVGLPKEYLLQHPRPVLVKDFFLDDLVRVFRMKRKAKAVRIQWLNDPSDIPV